MTTLDHGNPATLHGAGRHLVVGLSGASGMPYTRVLVRLLLERTGYTLHLVMSPSAADVLNRECGLALRHGKLNLREFLDRPPTGVEAEDSWRCLEERVAQYPSRDIGARPASGSFLHDGMVICPCSMRTVGALSVGVTDNLLTRAADVTLKERRKLVLVPRETPLSLIHLRALTTLAEAGAIILPAMPGFYHRPESLDQLVEFLAMKILDQLGVPYDSAMRWNPGGV